MDKIQGIVEALIFASDEPLPLKQIQDLIDDVKPSQIKNTVDTLNHDYKQTGRAFQIVESAGGYQMVTRDSYSQYLRKLFQKKIKSRLSQAALETLSVIAFKQPVSRVEVDAIRGVNSDGVVHTLLERKLITITGRAEGAGRPLLYATTKGFLRYFGINDVSDLPKPRELEELLKESGDKAVENPQKDSIDPSENPQEESVNPESGAEDSKDPQEIQSETAESSDNPETKELKGGDAA
ncbi:SMC-Scp complex subunit ScpB [candidate division KSB1 bacterium]|nr:SMC-Scp complex subunit ScpB [candidate division KSB1 bacterium]